MGYLHLLPSRGVFIAMLLPDHSYVKAKSLEECLKTLRETGEKAKVVAGGTDVIFNMRLKLFQPEVAVSIRGLKDLQQVEELDDGSVRIGAACRLADLIDHPLAGGRYPAFKQSLEAVASTHIRNMGTLGGNICLETRCWYTNNSDQWREGLQGCYKTDSELCHVIKSSSKCLIVCELFVRMSKCPNVQISSQYHTQTRDIQEIQFIILSSSIVLVLDQPTHLISKSMK